MFQPNYFDRLAFCVSVPCIGEMPFPSGRPARYGNVRPTDYRDTLEHLLAIQAWERILRKPSVGIVPMGFSCIGRSTKVPPDLRRLYVDHVYCPAVSIRSFLTLDRISSTRLR